MPTRVSIRSPSSQTPDARAVRVAADSLRRGELVVFPTETLYGVGASAASDAAIARLAALPRPGASATTDHTWHAPSREAVLRAVPIVSHVHRRVISRLTPGPVRLLIPLDAEPFAGAVVAIGARPGVLEKTGELGVRVPDDTTARALLEAAGVPVVAERTSAMGWGSGSELPPGFAAAPPSGVSAALDTGPTRYGTASTTIRLTREGGYSIVREGAWSARELDQRLTRTVLFVCTGNTCRSPMAEAIAAGLFERETRPKTPLRFLSAGVAAHDGAPISPEACDVLESQGFAVRARRSRTIDAGMLRDADVIYTMTASHREAVLDLDPTAAPRVFTIDPGGGDVPDPIGGPASLYRQTAEALARHLRARLRELDEDTPGHGGD